MTHLEARLLFHRVCGGVNVLNTKLAEDEKSYIRCCNFRMKQLSRKVVRTVSFFTPIFSPRELCYATCVNVLCKLVQSEFVSVLQFTYQLPRVLLLSSCIKLLMSNNLKTF